MKVIYEKSLWDFRNECRYDIRESIDKLYDMDKLNVLEIALNYEYPYGISGIELQDLFATDFDYLLSLIGMTEEEFYNEGAEE